ncbi:MAG TPA: hydrogenase maturation nickel metallochaperone HypA [Verrucomicrobiae bacterium]|nr:hydrogenase maturation nickel metallochaperone HypA [Verrucomicrobiae bacterium]
MESVLEFAASRELAEVRRVRLAVGELTCVQPEQLRFCYESLVKETAISGSELDIETVRARVKCASCRYDGAPRYWEGALAAASVPTLQCPECGGSAEAVEGHECAIRSIQYVN